MFQGVIHDIEYALAEMIPQKTVRPFQHEPQYCSTTNPTVNKHVGHWKASQSQFVPPNKPPNNPPSNNVKPFVEQSNPWTETIHPSLVSTLKKNVIDFGNPPPPWFTVEVVFRFFLFGSIHTNWIDLLFIHCESWGVYPTYIPLKMDG